MYWEIIVDQGLENPDKGLFMLVKCSAPAKKSVEQNRRLAKAGQPAYTTPFSST